jgi:hypothetical protein
MRISTLATMLATSATLALAGCGGSSAAGNPANGTHSGSGSGTTGNAGPQPASSHAQSADVCAALPAAAASQITGTKFTTTKASNVEGVIFDCEYDGPNAALLQISVAIQDGKQGFDADVAALKAVQHAPTLVSGVGDEAFSEPDPNGNAGSAGASAFASYGAVFGDTYIKIGGLTYVTADQGRQIVEQLHAKL